MFNQVYQSCGCRALFRLKNCSGKLNCSNNAVNDSHKKLIDSTFKIIRKEEHFIDKQHDLLRKLKSRQITLPQYHLKRLDILEEYTNSFKDWNIED